MPWLGPIAFKCREQAVGHDLAGLDVARHDGGRILRRKHRVFRYNQLDRLEAAGIHRDRLVDHDAEDVERRGAGHRHRRVEVVGLNQRGIREIDLGRPRRLVDRDLDFDVRALVGLDAERAVRQFRQQPAHAFLGVVLDVLHVGLDHVEAEVIDHLAKLGDALGVGGDVRLEIGDVLVR